MCLILWSLKLYNILFNVSLKSDSNSILKLKRIHNLSDRFYNEIVIFIDLPFFCVSNEAQFTKISSYSFNFIPRKN